MKLPKGTKEAPAEKVPLTSGLCINFGGGCVYGLRNLTPTNIELEFLLETVPVDPATGKEYEKGIVSKKHTG